MCPISAEGLVWPNLRFGSAFAERVRGSVDHYKCITAQFHLPLKSDLTQFATFEDPNEYEWDRFENVNSRKTGGPPT